MELPKRIQWLECAKTVAIIAVIIDHTYGLLYTNIVISRASFFSVGLFILVSGIVVQNGEIKNFSHQLKKVGSLYLQYALATAIILLYSNKFFDLKSFLSHLLKFTVSNHFYYLLFFPQLMLIAPLLVSWCRFCNKRKERVFFHCITLCMLCWMASQFIRHTYILPVWGAGQFLFGGTYVILYYIGILLGSLKVFEPSKWSIYARIACFVTSMWVCVMLVYLRILDKLPIDKKLEPYFGQGINPPSVQSILFSIAVLFACFSLFTLLEEISWKWTRILLYITRMIGKNTLYIYLYHVLVRDAVNSCLPENTNIWIMRGVFFISMLYGPVIFIYIIRKIKNRVYLEDN